MVVVLRVFVSTYDTWKGVWIFVVQMTDKLLTRFCDGMVPVYGTVILELLLLQSGLKNVRYYSQQQSCGKVCV